jgi:deazaflavin-dependent oxidoreductase (nitroreductase family)
MTPAEKRTYNPEFLYLTTTGWKSGKPHEIEIWFVEHEGRYYLVSEHREQSHWVKNILHNSNISFWVEGHTHQGSGCIIDPQTEPELAAIASAKMDAKYGWSEGLIIELASGT